MNNQRGRRGRGMTFNEGDRVIRTTNPDSPPDRGTVLRSNKSQTLVNWDDGYRTSIPTRWLTMTVRDPIVSDSPLWYCGDCDKLTILTLGSETGAVLCEFCAGENVIPWDYDAEDVGNHPPHPAEKENK